MAVFDTDEESTKQYNRLRRDTGTTNILGDTDAEEYFAESQEKFPSDQTKMVAYARVLVFRGIMASSSLLGKYAQNQSQEDLTKVFDNLKQLVDYWEAETEKVFEAVDVSEVSPFFFGVAQGQRGR